MRRFPPVESYRAASRSIQFRLFAGGDHGFGVCTPGTPAEGWMNLNLCRPKTQHMLDGGR